MRQLALSLASTPSPTLDNFVVGRNAELHAVLSALAGGDRSERFIFLWGAHGCGKTHLLKAMAAAFARHHVTVATLTGPGMRPQLQASEAVLADDVDDCNDEGQERLFNVYNVQRDSGGILIAAAHVPPARLAMRKDLVTRLGWGLVYQVHMLSDEEKMAALTEHARARGFNLSREVIDYLLRRRTRDLPGLLALLEALDRYSLENKRAITIPLVRELVSGSES